MARQFRFGLVTMTAPTLTAWTSKARKAEELGYATMLMPDRPTFGGLAPFSALAVAAAATTTLRVGSYVFCNDYRHPVFLAREAATLDLLSEGRFEPGLGAGVGPGEFAQLGIPFASPGTRIGRLEESIQIIKQLFTEDIVNFNGKHFTITNMRGSPRPIQKPRPPILVAASGERMLKMAANAADIIAIGAKITPQGFDPNDATLAQKVAWIKEGAGTRFDDLELSQTIYDLNITDSPIPLSTQMGGPPLPKRPITTEEVVEYLLEQRETYNLSYFQVSDAQMENFAPVIARLANK